MPTKKSFKAAHAVVGGRAFIFGGLDDKVKLKTLSKISILMSNQVPISNVFSFHSESKRWSKVAVGAQYVHVQKHKCEICICVNANMHDTLFANLYTLCKIHL